MKTKCLGLLVILLLGLTCAQAMAAEYQLFARTNLVAWCIVPFDAKKRGPDARAAMLEELGLRLFAYDYRAEHIPTFDAELEALERHGIRLIAWWFPGELNAEARLILEVLHRHKTTAQLWVTGGGEPTKSDREQKERIAAESRRIGEIAREAGKIGCTVGLYNHGGWFGEPENQVSIIERLQGEGITNVGIVYNQHHGHSHVGRFAELLQLMKPHLLCLNLNGMIPDGDRVGQKIVVLGQSDLDLPLLRIVQESGWHGPLGILNHTDEDADARLRQNLSGLDQLVRKMGIEPAPRR
jgi:sugar phosphate isomerase/epimerase